MINITFISDVVLHMVANSTSNKDNGCVGDILNDNAFFGDIVDKQRKVLSNIRNENV